MGRAPCCDKANVKKGPWSPEEDATLKSYIEKHGTGGNWIALPQKIGLKRCGKSCRLRWLNYLRPNIKHGGFSEEEDNIICSLYISIGSRWSIIAAQLPGRTDNDIKNYWNTRLKKKLLGKQRKEQHQSRKGLIKQEMKRLNENQMLPPPNINNNQNPFNWPELPFLSPIPYSNQESRFNDHASIRKLLIKLGGRFSIDANNDNPQFSQQLNYDKPSSSSSCSSMEVVNDAFQFAQQAVEYNTDEAAAGFQMLQQEQGNLGLGVEEIAAFNNPQRLDGLEFLLADEMFNNNNNRGASVCYGNETDVAMGEMLSSLQVYPPMPPRSGLDELRYHGSL